MLFYTENYGFFLTQLVNIPFFLNNEIIKGNLAFSYAKKTGVSIFTKTKATNDQQLRSPPPKGQIILEGNFDVFKFPRKTKRNSFKDFWPSL
mgnify:CR=1 FL=1